MSIFAKTQETLDIDVKRLRVLLTLASNRIKVIVIESKAKAPASRREAALLSMQGKIHSAQIKAEQLIRNDALCESFELLEHYCELVQLRLDLMQCQIECEESLVEPISTLIYASVRANIPELKTACDLFKHRFGSKFYHRCLENVDGKVNVKVVQNFLLKPPDSALITQYLSVIEEAYRSNEPYASGNENQCKSKADAEFNELLDRLDKLKGK